MLPAGLMRATGETSNKELLKIWMVRNAKLGCSAGRVRQAGGLFIPHISGETDFALERDTKGRLPII